jgi:hypothetical protein
MSEFIQGFMILDSACKVLVADSRVDAGEADAELSRATIDRLPSGVFWAVAQRLENGRRVCRLTRIDREQGLSFESTLTRRMETRLLLDDSFSPGFRLSSAELMVPGLANKDVPAAVVDAFVLANAEPIANLVIA